MPKILDKINVANDIKNIEPKDYKRLASEIREFIISNVSKTGGHFASNLGVIELTIALHLSLDFPKDKLIWDVGHQAYTHKILTGRKDGFKNLRHYNGLSGFPKMEESECDAFNVGHSSTSISIGLGYAKARDIKKENYKIFAVIGDGALSGGMAYEALNNAARLKSNMVIVLNDNKMSISENVGGMANYLGKIRTGTTYSTIKTNVEKGIRMVPLIGNGLADRVKKSKDSLKSLVIPGMLFEDMGLTYIGPIDGHNISQMLYAFNNASKAKGPVIVHVVTQKGKGYKLAEKNPSKYHGVGSFKTKTGESAILEDNLDYTTSFTYKMIELASKDESVVAVSAAMLNGTGLNYFGQQFEDRLFDVGIAEEHAVTFAAAMAAGGLKPVVAIYSTFLQRAYDQILHDVCISGHHVVLAIDRAGIVGPDGATHQGIYDISYLRTIPNMTIIAPKNRVEFDDMLEYAVEEYDGPIAIRYPKGAVYEELSEYNAPIEYGKAEVIYNEKDILLLAFGSMNKVANSVWNRLKEEGYNATFVNLRFAAPIDFDTIRELIDNHTLLVTMEENVYNGGIGQAVSAWLKENKYNIDSISVALPDKFIEHGKREFLLEKYGLDADSIYNKIIAAIK